MSRRNEHDAHRALMEGTDLTLITLAKDESYFAFNRGEHGKLMQVDQTDITLTRGSLVTQPARPVYDLSALGEERLPGYFVKEER